MILDSKIVELLKILQDKDLHVYEIDHDDISHLNKFPLAHIFNASVYVMHKDEIVYVGSKRGVYYFAKNFISV